MTPAVVIKEHEYFVRVDGRSYEVIMHDAWEPLIYDAAESEVKSVVVRAKVLAVVASYNGTYIQQLTAPLLAARKLLLKGAAE